MKYAFIIQTRKLSSIKKKDPLKISPNTLKYSGYFKDSGLMSHDILGPWPSVFSVDLSLGYPLPDSTIPLQSF